VRAADTVPKATRGWDNAKKVTAASATSPPATPTASTWLRRAHC